MKYHHRFLVRASLASVSEFHSRAKSMAAITPLPIIIQMKHAPATLAEEDVMDFTMWLGPFPIHWLARIQDVSAIGFTDRQLEGPFAEWVHQHIFEAVDEQSSVILDEVNLRLRSHPIWWLVGMAMWLGLPLLFAYRAWKTRRTLQ
jgi:ligand-binding SRPBCC domain-containing protein